MSLDIANTDKLSVFYQDAKRFGVKIRPPCVNRSGADFEVEPNEAGEGEVLYALGAIRNVGLEAMKHVVQVRRQGGPFADIFDFVERVDPRQVNKRTFETLARAGAFDEIHPNRAQLIERRLPGGAWPGRECARDLGSGRLLRLGQVHRARRHRAQDAQARSLEPHRAVGRGTGRGRLLPLGPPAGRPWSRRCAASARTCSPTPSPAPTPGPRRSGWRAWCAASRSGPSRSGEKFAFVTFSDPTGEYEVLFPPEQLRKCRDLLEPGRALSLKVRAKASDGEVRFFGDDVEPVEKAVENVVAACACHVARERRDRGAEEAAGDVRTAAAARSC
jgi:DNA polymerase-3 subunit alpha